MTPPADIPITVLADIWSTHGLWAIGATIALLAAFFLLRGRVRIEKGWGGFSIVRFGRFDRLAHWLLASSFLALALADLTVQHGFGLFGALLGDPGRGEIVRMREHLQSVASVVFLASLPFAFALWVRHSLPHWRDAVWLLKGGGLIVRRTHLPAGRFNAGQKLLFWIVILCGAWVSGLIPRYEGYGTAWHGVPALLLTCAVIVHIYLRTVGIQGAASAMISGEVDANWARQHHSLWAEQEIGRMEDAAAPARSDAAVSPAD
jgi:formate dehydrogenase subunit gamma